MLMSRRAKRMAQHHNRMRRGGSLQLVSLMDIFTILVFFLLVSSTEVEVLPSSQSLHLPESRVDQRPNETVVVMLTEDEIIVQGDAVMTIDEALSNDKEGLEPLQAAMEQQTEKLVRKVEDGEETPLEVTVMADKSHPYRLLKKVMTALGAANYSNLSLAVVQKNANQEAP